MTARRILIAEDETVVAMGLQERLENLGYVVEGVVDTGEEAVRLAQERQPGLVLMDIRLAGAMDGIDAAEAIRRRCGVPVIFLTAFADDETLERAKLCEPLGYLQKPVRERELRASIEVGLHRHEVEAQSRREEKSASLVTMTGGVAHTINNLLTPVLGYATLAQGMVPSSSPALPMLAEIEGAARQAADVVRQMVGFAGTGCYGLREVDLSEVVQGLVDESLPCRPILHLAASLPRVVADPDQVRILFGALVANAMESLGKEGGRIIVRTLVREVDPATANALSVGKILVGERYGVLEVEDEGCGMSPEHVTRMFDPFYTTKFLGRGLGLATVRGIVRAHRGAIQVRSAPGQGTTVAVFFPVGAAGGA